MKGKTILAALVLVFLASCGKCDKPLVVFYAPCFSPVMDAVRDESEKSLGVRLAIEINGSQVCCRKVTELGRECDLLMLADSGLFKRMASTHCDWRLDFAHDSIVLGIGIRAKRTDDAEKDWVPVLLDGSVALGRVDENLGPIGYRTLLVWALKEKTGHPGLGERLRKKCARVADHVSQLAALLKAGDLDYGFLYRTTCLKYDIRYIGLDKKVNLGSAGEDYSGAEASFKKLKAGREEVVTVRGGIITYGLTVPAGAPNGEKAIEFIKYLLGEKKNIFVSKGFVFFRPRFYGKKPDFKPFEGLADYAGDFR